MKIKFFLPLAALLVFFGCNPDDPAIIGGGNTLADKIVGTFVGTYTSQSTTELDYSITVTKVSDTEVKFAPTNGSVSATFNAILAETTMGSVTSISIKSSDDILENNGTFVESTGSLSYSFHLGGSDDRNLEIFLGDKQ